VIGGGLASGRADLEIDLLPALPEGKTGECDVRRGRRGRGRSGKNG
jgi:hypothetical protein